MNSVLNSDPEANIILCSDKENNLPPIRNITFEQVESRMTKKIKEINYSINFIYVFLGKLIKYL